MARRAFPFADISDSLAVFRSQPLGGWHTESFAAPGDTCLFFAVEGDLLQPGSIDVVCLFDSGASGIDFHRAELLYGRSAAEALPVDVDRFNFRLNRYHRVSNFWLEVPAVDRQAGGQFFVRLRVTGPTPDLPGDRRTTFGESCCADHGGSGRCYERSGFVSPRAHGAIADTDRAALRLSLKLKGPTIWIKRDDRTGLAGGGNKARKLEYFVAEALKQKSDLLITAGGAQSNHCRQTAAAAVRNRLGCDLVLGGSPPAIANGNLLLDELLGAELHWTAPENRSQAMEELAEKRRRQGRGLM